MKKAVRIICVALIMIALVVGTLMGFLSIDEYKPKDIESLEITGNSVDRVKREETTTLLSWNLLN